eukprot:SAG11_NODE_56_length_19295_cov_20.219675_20_plen_107_part_00
MQWRALEAKSKEMNPKPLDSPKAKAKVEWKEIRLKAVLKILGKGDSHHQQVDIGHLAQVETEMGRQLDAMTEGVSAFRALRLFSSLACRAESTVALSWLAQLILLK